MRRIVNTPVLVLNIIWCDATAEKSAEVTAEKAAEVTAEKAAEVTLAGAMMLAVALAVAATECTIPGPKRPVRRKIQLGRGKRIDTGWPIVSCS
jgi:hypothetical protein